MKLKRVFFIILILAIAIFSKSFILNAKAYSLGSINEHIPIYASLEDEITPVETIAPTETEVPASVNEVNEDTENKDIKDVEILFNADVNEEIPGSIDKPGEIDIYKLTVEKNAILHIYTTGTTDTFGKLLNEEGQEIIADDDSGDLKNFSFEQEVAPGNYQVCITHCYPDQVGSYVLIANCTELSEDDFGNDIESAKEINIGEAISGNIGKPGDIDFFKITVDKKIWLEVYSEGTTDTFGTLLDGEGNQIISDDDSSGQGKNFKIAKEIEPGTYYLSVRHFYPERIGAYVLNTKSTEVSEDDYANDRDNAFEINPPCTVNGEIENRGDVDCFKVRIETEGELELFTLGSTDTLGFLEDSNGNVICSDDDSGTGKNFTINQLVQPGTYYIKVQHYYADRVGKYELHVTCNNVSDDYGNEIASSTEIMAGVNVPGAIQYGGDVDFFKIIINNDCEIVASTSGNTDTFGTLYNEEGEAIAFNDDDGMEKNFQINKRLSSGTYYLEVKHYYPDMTGEYILFLELGEAADSTIVSLDEGDSHTCGFAYDGERYAYVGCNTTPARIVKFDVQEMKRVTAVTFPANENRDECRVASIISISPDIVIHASFTDPCVFTRIDPHTMEITGTLIGEEGDKKYKLIRSMVYDGVYVYAATYSTPASIIKIDPVNMKIVDSYTFSAEEATEIHKITIVGDYIAGVCDRDTDVNAKIFRIKKDDLHGPVETIYVPGVTNYHSVCNDGRYLYAAAHMNPTTVVKIDALAKSMEHMGTFEGIKDVEAGNYSVVYTGASVVVGTWNFNQSDRLITINPVNMQKINSIIFLPSFPADLHFINSSIYTCTDNATGNIVRWVVSGG